VSETYRGKISNVQWLETVPWAPEHEYTAYVTIRVDNPPKRECLMSAWLTKAPAELAIEWEANDSE